MDAKKTRIGSLSIAISGLLFCVSLCSDVLGQSRTSTIHTFATPNFVVHANNPQWARQVGEAAETNRRDLAIHWLGRELPRWSKPCPLMVNDHPTFAASGETKYTIIPERGAVVNFNMTVRGTRERIIDSVLPHEITHTIVASHFAPLGKTVPRWADEGMCTTVEHEAERRKHDTMLVQFLRQGKGISFETLFALKEYPADILPLYAQGYSLTSFLIAQGGPRQFIQFLEHGMKSDDWNGAINHVYGYPLKGKLQTAWNRWVADGGGDISRHTALALGYTNNVSLASNNSTPSSNDVRLAAATAPTATSPIASASQTSSASLPNSPASAVSPRMVASDVAPANYAINVNEAKPAQFVTPPQAMTAGVDTPRSLQYLNQPSTGTTTNSPDSFVPPSFSRAANEASSPAESTNPNTPTTSISRDPNIAMHPSNSYYVQRLQQHSMNGGQTEPIRISGGQQHAVSQPGPLQTIGGDTVYR